MEEPILWALAATGVICLLGIAFAIMYNFRCEQEVELRQSIPTVPKATLPVHETSVRAIKYLKPAEPLPEPLVEADFDPEGAPGKRKTRLLDLIRDTQTKA